MEFTRKCWTLILDNASTLQSLRIMKNSRQTLLRLAPPSRTRDFPYLRPDSLEFLKAALDKMPRLQELEAGKQAEEYVLQNIGRGRGLEEGFLSRVTSLHYSAMSGYALHTLLHPPKGLGVGDSDDKNSNKNNIELENDNISDNTTVKKLTISNTVSISCLRDLLVAFPHLQELSGARHDSLADSSHQPSHLGSFHASNLDKVIVSNIKYLTDLQHEFQLFRFNIRMPFLKGMGPKVFFRSVEDLMHILQLCPDLETLEVEELCGLDDHLAIAYVDQHTRRDLELSGGGGIDAEVDSDRSRRNAGMDWKIQTLTIQHSQYRAHTIPQLLRRMPNLVRLELGSISAKAVEVIGETCYESLEDVKFHLRSPCFQEMNLLLVKCSRLRSVRGLGLAVLAEDLRRMDEGEGGEGWSCLGVRELQIEIHGVPRLTCRQEEILFKESTASNNNDSTGVSSEDKEEYKEALSQHRTNEAVRHRVLDQLGRLQELRVLDLSFQPLVYKHYQSRFCDGSSQHRKDRIPICDYPVPNSLSLSLSRSPPALHFTVVNKTSPPVTAGLEQLATLKNLEVIGFKAVEHGMGEAEVRWMSEHWPRLRTVLGVSGVLYKGHGTGNINCRCLDADVLPVGIRTLFERWVPGVEVKVDVAGHSLQVSDNGDGISPTDMARIGTRYATSKCSSLQDLNRITTYGFRGEAVAAITEMSLVDIVSRRKGHEHVFSTIFKGGDKLFCGPSSKYPRFSHGTTVSVRDLFYKFPVRQRYWSDASTSKLEAELEKVKRVVETLALVAPRISFAVIDMTKDTKIMSCRSVDSQLHRITTILGQALSTSLSFVKSSRDLDPVYNFSGFISTQGHYNRMYQYIFLNQRPVQCENLQRLVTQLFQQSSFAADSLAYAQQDVRRSRERHPIFVLMLTCPTSEYDLCADPSKVTIQFEDEEKVFQVVRCTIIDFLERHHLLSRTAATALRQQSGTKKRKRHASISMDTFAGMAPLDYISRVKTSQPSRPSRPVRQIQTYDDDPAGLAYQNEIDLEDELEFELDADWMATMLDDDFVSSEVEYTRRGDQGLLLPRAAAKGSISSRTSLPHMTAAGSKPFTTGTSGIWAQDALRKWVNPVLPTAPIQVPCLQSPRLDSTGRNDSCEHESIDKRISRFFSSGSASQTGLNAESLQLSKDGLRGAKVISQLDCKFILCTMEHFSPDATMTLDGQDGSVNKVLVVIDQHAADERVRVERLMKEMCTCSQSYSELRSPRDDYETTIITHRLDSMAMIPPLPIILTRREWHLAEQSAEWLYRWGIVIEESLPQGGLASPDDGSETDLETVMVSQHFTRDDELDDIGSTISGTGYSDAGGSRVRTRMASGSVLGVESDYRQGRVVSLPRIVADRCVVDGALTQDLIKDALGSFEEGRYRSRKLHSNNAQGPSGAAFAMHISIPVRSWTAKYRTTDSPGTT
ncbi:DNA mismatch repair protein [Mortierella sp. 14UC]|nr:DNA mismatch repair protein [Mortierella sp. 14UC]